MSGRDEKPLTRAGTAAPATSSGAEIARFLEAAGRMAPAAAGARGRLVFALDATASRQPTWDRAATLQAEMFDEAARSGELAIQIAYFRGFSECRASPFLTDAAKLRALMQRIDCRGGQTQLVRLAGHVRTSAAERGIAALVYVGDAFEEEPDALAAVAGELRLLGVKAFVFQEGRDPIAERAFRDLATITGGAWCRFDAAASAELAALLRAAAAYAAGGRAALDALALESRGSGARLLIGQMT